MSLTASIKLTVEGTEAVSVDLGGKSATFTKKVTQNFTDGSGAGQVSKYVADSRTLAGTSSEELDLSGGFTDAFGNSILFTRVVCIAIIASADNDGNLVVGAAAANAFAAPFADASDAVIVRPGGVMLLQCQDATGYAVVADTGDLLQVENLGSETAAYDVVILGS